MKYDLGYTRVVSVTGFLSRTLSFGKKREIAWVCDALKTEDQARILDYGCNGGHLLKIIQRKHPSKNFNLCGADINPHALSYAKKKYPSFTFYELTDTFFAQEKFDVIILSHVLEHIKERNIFLANMRKLLRKNGKLIVAVPQERFRGDMAIPQIIYNFFRFRFENPHVAKIHYDDLQALLQGQGFRIENHVYTNFFFPFTSDTKKIYSWSLLALCQLND